MFRNQNKRAQFFLLAAVIISLVIISLGATTNRIATKEGNFQDIDDFSYQVQKETGEVLNYEIYTDVSDGKVEDFARLMAKDIQDKDPSTQFVFVFGNNESMTISNYGKDDVGVVNADLTNAIYCRYGVFGRYRTDNDRDKKCAPDDANCYVCNPLHGRESCPTTTVLAEDSSCTNYRESVDGVTIDPTCTYWGGSKDCTKEGSGEPKTIDLTPEELASGVVTVTVDGVDVPIPVSEYKQVELIVKRDSGNETYVSY